MRALLLSVLVLSPINTYADTPTPFDAAAWQKLSDKAAADASNAQEDGNGNEYHALVRLSATDPMVSHTANYFSVVGNTQTDGTFGRNHVEIVSETWTVDAQKIRTVDQWAYALDLKGNLTFAMHQQFSEDADGRVLTDEEPAVPALTDATLLAQVGAKITEWETAK